MREFPKIRKTAKWGGLAVAVAMLALWAGTGWRQFGRGGTDWTFDVGAQGVWWCRIDLTYPITPRGWEVTPAPGWHVNQLRPQWVFRTGHQQVWIPFWMSTLGASLIAAGAWRLDVLAARRRRTGGCAKCGYDRAGIIASSPCPECGTAAVVAKADATTQQPKSPMS